MPGVGDAWIEVHADGSSLYREIREATAAAVRGAKITLKVDLDTKGLKEKVKAAANLASKSAKIKFTADFDAKGLSAKVKAAAKLAGGTVKVKTDVDSANLRALSKAIPKSGGAGFLTDAEAIATGARRALLTARRALVERPIVIPAKIELKKGTVIAQAAALSALFKANPINMPVKLDISAFSRARIAATREFARLRHDIARTLAPIGGAIGSVFSGIASSVGSIGKSIFEPVLTVFKFTAAQAGLLTVAVAAALPYIEALGVAVAGLAVELGSAALAGAGFVASGLVAVGAAAATALIGVQGLGNAFKAYQKIQQKQAAGLKVTKKDWAELKATMKGLAPAAQTFVTRVESLGGAWSKLTKSVQQHLFFNIGKELQTTFTAVLPALRTGLDGIADVLNQAATGFLEWARSAPGIKAINDIFGQSKVVLTDLLHATGQFSLGLLNLFTGGRKNAQGLGSALDDLAGRFKNWTAVITTPGANGRTPLQDFFTSARQNLTKFWGLLQQTGSLVSAFWNNWNGAAAGAKTDILGDLTGQFKRWTDFLTNPANAGAIKTWIAERKADFDSLKTAVLDTAHFLNTVSLGVQAAFAPPGQDAAQWKAFWDAVNNTGGGGAKVQHNIDIITSVNGNPADPNAIKAGLNGVLTFLTSEQLAKKWEIPVGVKIDPVALDEALSKVATSPNGGKAVTKDGIILWRVQPTVEEQALVEQWAKALAAAGIDPGGVVPVIVQPTFKTAPGDAARQGLERLAGLQATIKGKINIAWEPPPDAEVEAAALKAAARGKRTFTFKGAKYKITAKGEWELVTHPPTHQELVQAALKAGIKPGHTFTIKGVKYKLNIDGTITIVPHLTDIQKQIAGVVKGINKGKPATSQFTWTVDPKVKIGTLSEKDKERIKTEISRAITTGKDRVISIKGKKYLINVDGKFVSIEPYKGPPIPIPVEPKLPDVPPKPPGSWGGGIPVFASLTLTPGSAGAVQSEAQRALGGGVTIPTGYAPLPAFPVLPKPDVKIGTGYAPLPGFPTLPKPHVTVGTGYAPLPHFPTLPHKSITIGIQWGKVPFLPLPSPTITVKVKVEKVGAGGLVSGAVDCQKNPNDPRCFAKGMVAAANGIHITRGPQVALIGEAGPEAVVPLRKNQPLDPAVESLLLSVAQSRGLATRQEVGPAVGTLNVNLPTGDPYAAAMTVANRIALIRTV